MKNKFTQIFNLFCFVVIVSLVGSLSTQAKVNDANGEWQYFVRRGDTNGHNKKELRSNPNCPFYVGYFSLDFQPVSLNRNFKWKPEYNQVLKTANSSQAYVIGPNSYEKKGSYTPYNTNEYCSNPITKTVGEKAPITMTKISPSGKKLEWVTDFTYGTKKENAEWHFDATMVNKNQMRGVLKAYLCSGLEKNKKCALLNTTKFKAKRIESIENRAGKALFKRENTTFFNWFIKDEGLFIDDKPYEEADSIILDNQTAKKYFDINIQTTLPSYAWLYGCKNSDIGVKTCLAKGGTKLSGCKCEVCRDFGCKDGNEPSQKTRACCFCQKGANMLCQCPCNNLNTCGGNPAINPAAASCVGP